MLEGDKFSENLVNSMTDDFVMKAEYYRLKVCCKCKTRSTPIYVKRYMNREVLVTRKK